MRKFFTFTIFLIALAAGIYTQRVEVLEWYRGVTAPELPEAVGYEEISQIDVIPSEVDGGVEGSPSEESEQLVDPSVDESLLQDDNDIIEASEESADSLSIEESIDESVVEEEPALPVSKNLAVPFTSQAPNGNWDEPYQEGCEEASVYMVHAYFSGMDEGRIPASTADEALLQIVEFEMELFGFYKDTTTEQTGVLAELMYGHTYQLVANPTVEDIQSKLVQGHPVIVPAAGRLLGNPYFTAPGPLYHMLVIRGYTEDGQFIVNDPGTYRGEAFLYDFDTIMNAMHDWNEGGEITDGGKVVLVLSP
ncbi:MAG TPA: C39 family peptidase [Patescibacteria group bacterium]|nr:C39 family peptidase [Patescibacteria group bacterium]